MFVKRLTQTSFSCAVLVAVYLFTSPADSGSQAQAGTTFRPSGLPPAVTPGPIRAATNTNNNSNTINNNSTINNNNSSINNNNSSINNNNSSINNNSYNNNSYNNSYNNNSYNNSYNNNNYNNNYNY